MKRPIHWPTRTHKYHAERTVVDGHRFASKREAYRYGELTLLERASVIRALTLQPRFPLLAPIISTGVHDVIATYIADFAYEEWEPARATWQLVVEDAKGVRTATYRLKKRWFETQYEIPIREV